MQVQLKTQMDDPANAFVVISANMRPANVGQIACTIIDRPAEGPPPPPAAGGAN